MNYFLRNSKKITNDFIPNYSLAMLGGARGVMVIVAEIGHGDTSSNPRLIAFHIALIPLGKVWIQLFSLQGRLGSSALVGQLV